MSILKHVDFEVPNWGELASGPIARRGYANASLDLSPLAYWRLGETSGTTVVDLSGNGDHGTYLAGVTPGATGLIAFDNDPSADFPGGTTANQNHITTPLGDAWLDNDFSIVVWATSDNVPALRDILGTEGTILTNKGIVLRSQSSRILNFQAHNGTSAVSVILNAWISAGETYFCGVTYKASTGLINTYLDGVFVASATLTGGFATNKVFNIGATNHVARRWNGRIDEVSIYANELSASQLLDLYRMGIGELYQA